MIELKAVFTAVIPVFALVLGGIFLRKKNWLTAEADTSLLRLIINLFIPALIFASVTQNPAMKRPDNLLLGPLVGFCTVALGMGVGLIGARFLGFKERSTAGTFALCIGLYNYGYVPLPLAELLYDRQTVGVLFVHNVGVETALWTLGLVLLKPLQGKETSKPAFWGKLLNAPVIVIIGAVTLNLLDLDTRVPRVVFVTAGMLGQCAIPLGLLLVGATLADHLHEFHFDRSRGTMGMGVILRLGLLPLIFLLIAKFLPCSIELKRVIVLEAAMPSAVFPIVMARHYGGDAGVALRVVVATSLTGLITLPLWIRFGSYWVGV